jgi:hypothetical protein
MEALMQESAQEAAERQREQEVDATIAELKAYGGVAILGAGISLMARYPGQADLDSMVAHALDQSPNQLDSLRQEFRLPGATARQILDRHPATLGQAWGMVAADDQARLAFQTAFAALDRERSSGFSPAHAALAELLHKRIIEVVVSLNWDTQLERAYAAKYGVQPLAEWLRKPHGDAAKPHSRWVLPGEESPAPHELIRQLSAMVATHPRVLLIVGYSEGDRAIVEEVIAPLEAHWRAIRVSPEARGVGAINDVAESVIPELARRLRTASPWRYQHFLEFGNVGRALLGESLGPADVQACPELHVVGDLHRRLTLAHAALLFGESGSGKSLAAYQAAKHYVDQSFACVALDDYSCDEEELIASALSFPHPTVLVVEDGERLPEARLQRLLLAATSNRKVIVATNLRPARLTSAVELIGREEVKVLAQWALAKKALLLPLVQQLDDRVGDAYLDEPYEQRITEAAQSTTPWQFMFTLAGGWRRARRVLATVRDEGRADLALVAIAVGQVASLDAPADPDRLQTLATHLGRSREWLSTSIGAARERRVLVAGPALKCVHQRVAQYVIAGALDVVNGRHDETVLDIVREALLAPAYTLRGKVRLLSDVRATHSPPYGSLIDEQLLGSLIESCWRAPTEEVGDAGLLLSALISFNTSTLGLVRRDRTYIERWLQLISPRTAYGVAWLVNRIGNADRQFASDLISAAPAGVIANHISSTGWDYAYSWGWALRMLLSSANPEWRRVLGQHLDRKRLTRLAASMRVDDLSSFDELVSAVVYQRPDIVDLMLEAATPALLNIVNRDPAEIANLNDTFMSSLGYPPRFLSRKPPESWQRRRARKLAAGFDAKAFARWASQGTLRDWEQFAQLGEWLYRAHRRKFQEIVAHVDLAAIRVASVPFWVNPPRELCLVLAIVGSIRQQDVDELVISNVDLMQTMPWRLGTASPRAAAVWLGRGHTIELEVEAGVGWDAATELLGAVADVDVDAARQMLENNVDDIGRGLSLPQATSTEDALPFIDLAERLSPGLVRSALATIDAPAVEAHWTARLRGRFSERRVATRLWAIAQTEDDELGALSRRLAKRFPSLRRSRT